MTAEIRASLSELSDALALVLAAAGASGPNAALVADHLVEAQAMGHASHGVRLVRAYTERLLGGEVSGTAQPFIARDSGCMLRIDGNAAFGQVVGAFASALGVERAKAHGVCLVAVGNARHLGRNGRWAENAAREGVASIHFGHGFSPKPSVVAYGSVDRRLGTSPIAIGAPSPDGGVIVDFSVAETSSNTVRMAFERGERLPFAALMRRDGVATDDPAAYADGIAALMTFGGFKGYGLAVLSQIFAAGMGAGGPMQGGHNSMLSIYFDVAQVVDADVYDAYIARLVDDLHSATPVPGGARVPVPGDRSRAALSGHAADGIALDQAELAAIMDAAAVAGNAGQLAQRWPAIFGTAGSLVG